MSLLFAYLFLQVQRLREKIVEQEAEHVKLTEENHKLKNEKQIMVSTFSFCIWLDF